MARQRRREWWGTDRRSPEPIPVSILARMRHAGQRAGAHLRPVAAEHPYAFLLGTRLDLATLERAADEAWRAGVAIHDVLISAGWISEPGYAAALAGRLGVPLIPGNAALEFADTGPVQELGAGLSGGSTAVRATCWPPPPRARCLDATGDRAARPRPIRGACDTRDDQRGGREADLAAPHRVRRARPVQDATGEFGAISHPGLAANGGGALRRSSDRRVLRAAGRDSGGTRHVDRPAVPVRDAAQACGSARSDGDGATARTRRRRGRSACRTGSSRSTRCWCRCSARPRCCPA